MKGLAALATLLGVTAAQAADMPRRQFAAPIQTVNWTGFYAGVGGGYGFAKDDRQTFDAIFNTLDVSTAPNGGFIHLKAGYNWQADRFVFGPQAVFALANMKSSDSATGSAFFGLLQTGATYSKSVDQFYQLQMRLGYLVTPNVLAYVKGGYMGGSGTVSGNITLFSSPYSVFTARNSFHGGTFGIGAEVALPDNWAIQFDYDYMGGKTSNVSYQNLFGTTTSLAVDNKFQTVGATLIKRF
ncbi:MAG: outer membrane beta-barrel protein [Patescibacteria group bacterium]